MKALNITDHWYPDKIGGSCKYAYELSKLLTSHQHKVKNIVIANPLHPEEKDVKVKKILSKINIFKNWRVIYKEISGADVIICHSTLSFLYSYFPLKGFNFKKKLNIKILGIIHGPWSQEFFSKYRHHDSYLKRIFIFIYPLVKLLDNFYLNKCDHLVFLSSTMAEEVLSVSNINTRFTIIPYWSTGKLNFTAVPTQNSNKPTIRFVSVRRLEFRMGIQNFLYALKDIDIDFEYFIIGEGRYQKTLQNIVKKLNLNSKVNFLGKLSDKEVLKIYKKSDYFIIPSITLEGFGLVCIECLEQGLPIIASNRVGFTSYINDKQQAVKIYSNTVELIRILNNLTNRSNISQSSFNHLLEKFNENEIGSKFTSLISTLYKPVL